MCTEDMRTDKKTNLKTSSNDKNWNSFGIQIDFKWNSIQLWHPHWLPRETAYPWLQNVLLKWPHGKDPGGHRRQVKEEKEAWVVLFCGQPHGSTKKLLTITPTSTKKRFSNVSTVPLRLSTLPFHAAWRFQTWQNQSLLATQQRSHQPLWVPWSCPGRCPFLLTQSLHNKDCMELH